MKILISPSKTQSPSKSDYLEDKDLLFPKQHKKVLATLRKLTKLEVSKAMKLKSDLLNTTYNNIKNYNTLAQNQAFESFNGLVYKGLEKELYHELEYSYIKDNLLILDAFYGLLEPGTLIKPYRLDFNMKIGLNLYNHWNISAQISDNLIINLASKEFSKLLDEKDLLNVHFLQNKNGKYINQATYSKQARGKILNYMIMNKIETTKGLKAFKLDNYIYNNELSDDHNIVFTR